MGWSPNFDIEVSKVIVKRRFRRFKKLNNHLVRYCENDGEIVWTRRFLFKPKKFQDGWHWLSWAFVKNTPNGLDWSTEWFSKDQFLLYKLSNELEKVK